MPADIFSLSKARKAKARSQDSKQAEQNRMLFGRTKGEKMRDNAEKERLQKAVDGVKLDPSEKPKIEL